MKQILKLKAIRLQFDLTSSNRPSGDLHYLSGSLNRNVLFEVVLYFFVQVQTEVFG